MELEPDLTKISNLRTDHPSERSGLWWVIVIAIGVLTGNALSFGAQELYTQWQIKEFQVTVDAMIDKQRAQASANNKALAKQRSVDAQLQQTCNFWNDQVRQEDTKLNRQYRDTACARMNGLFR
ncbi:hypothetical protein [Sedimenticola selenatireducens]|uniref:Uncharacterized protein n=1 Tax=Sedimenticola selenatireducens TaxID=191960 RepID=A0A557SD23_9GAMM|nr:hypothetical protein [Sedimenticola selenatireducens]TVO75231.1 hypothetical protein FHP88_09490 [Sedimenticola selenatireducens]TVT66915.1 MAG: hypothetical protein FHK78_00865 [Sedimenticola selenatireducens]